MPAAFFALGYGIESGFDLCAGFCGPHARLGKRYLAGSAQADVAALAIFLDANHPRAVAIRAYSKNQSLAVAVARCAAKDEGDRLQRRDALC